MQMQKAVYMDAIISVRGKKIQVKLMPHAVRITTDKELKELLRKEIKQSTLELATAIKSEYQKQFNTAFKVSDRSMSVEIWGHAYADEFAQWIKNFSRIRLVNKMADKVIYHARLIDIGEKGHDNNRFFWDALSPFLSLIAFFLP